MFVHKLQVLGILLALLAIINTSTTYVIRDIATYNTKTSNSISARDHKYSRHRVNFETRGSFGPSNAPINTCIHFLDWEQKSMWTYCSDDVKNHGQPILNGEIASPDWSVG